MSHEDEITTGPFDEGDEHDYSDHHHHHQQHENEHEQWNNDEKNDEKPEIATKRNLYISNLSFEVYFLLLSFPSFPFIPINSFFLTLFLCFYLKIDK